MKAVALHGIGDVRLDHVAASAVQVEVEARPGR